VRHGIIDDGNLGAAPALDGQIIVVLNGVQTSGHGLDAIVAVLFPAGRAFKHPSRIPLFARIALRERWWAE
jgi:hypothetical protein